MRLQGKIALVTGAGSGIGRATATLFAKEGAMVCVADVNDESSKQTADSIVAAGGEAAHYSGDVSVDADAQRMVADAVDAFGGLHVLVNSAGINDRQLPDTMSHDEIWDRVMGVNLRGTFLMCWHAVPAMLQGDGGAIVNLSSVMGLVGSELSGAKGFSAYVPSKGGVVQLTKNLAIEHARNNLRVNCICPGYIHTSLTGPLEANRELYEAIRKRHPMQRFGEPEEIAKAALFLASDEASFVTGITMPVDGGYTAQ